MSMFGQVIPFRAQRERVSAPAKPVHRSLSAALAEAGLTDTGPAELPPLSELTVDPEAGILAEELFPADALPLADEPFPADEPPSVPRIPAPVLVSIAPPPPPPVVAPVTAAVIPIPRSDVPPPVVAESPLPRVIARATRHPPNVAAYPWVKSARRRRFKARLSDATSWLVTIAIMAGMIGGAAIYLTPLRESVAPVVQR